MGLWTALIVGTGAVVVGIAAAMALAATVVWWS